VHMFPGRLFQAVRDALHGAFNWRFEHGTDPAELVAYLSGHGVERFFLLNYAHKPNVSARLNRWNYETAREFPRAVPFAAIHPLDDDLLEVAEQALDGFDLAGFKLHLDVMGLAPDDPSLFPIYGFARERGKPVIVHCGTGGSIRLKGDELNAGRLANVLQAFPDLKVCVPHLGARETGPFFDLADRHPNLWLDTAVALAPEGVCFSRVDRQRLRQMHRRLMFGSDFPNLGHSWEKEVQAVQEIGLSEGQLQMVFRDNAVEFAGLGVGFTGQ